MTDTVLQSFCERCGTRYTFTEPGAIAADDGKSKRGLFGRSRDEASETDDPGVATAPPSSERFAGTFHFCMDCRQYTCTTCWNPEAGACLSCRPPQRDGAPATGDAASVSPFAAQSGPESWPSGDVDRSAASAPWQASANDETPRAASDTDSSGDTTTELDEWGRPRVTPTEPTPPEPSTSSDPAPALDPWRGVVFSPDEEGQASDPGATAGPPLNLSARLAPAEATDSWLVVDQQPPSDQPTVSEGTAWPATDQRPATAAMSPQGVEAEAAPAPRVASTPEALEKPEPATAETPEQPQVDEEPQVASTPDEPELEAGAEPQVASTPDEPELDVAEETPEPVLETAPPVLEPSPGRAAWVRSGATVVGRATLNEIETSRQDKDDRDSNVGAAEANTSASDTGSGTDTGEAPPQLKSDAEDDVAAEAWPDADAMPPAADSVSLPAPEPEGALEVASTQEPVDVTGSSTGSQGRDESPMAPEVISTEPEPESSAPAQTAGRAAPPDEVPPLPPAAPIPSLPAVIAPSAASAPDLGTPVVPVETASPPPVQPLPPPAIAPIDPANVPLGQPSLGAASEPAPFQQPYAPPPAPQPLPGPPQQPLAVPPPVVPMSPQPQAPAPTGPPLVQPAAPLQPPPQMAPPPDQLPYVPVPTPIAPPPAPATPPLAARPTPPQPPGSKTHACTNCGLQLSAKARFCRRCGAQQG